MPRPPFANEQFYHVYNRGVLKQSIFFEDEDYERFVEKMGDLNNIHPCPDFRLRKKYSDPVTVKREPLVEILAWCLMPNHVHLFLRQIQEGGVSLFMQKIAVAHTGYINKKYKRSGHVFQGRFQVKHINSDNYLFHISRYIHLNPLDLIDWTNSAAGTEAAPATFRFLNQYKWSSYRDWLGKSGFPDILALERIRQLFPQGEEYKRFMESWVKYSDPVTVR